MAYAMTQLRSVASPLRWLVERLSLGLLVLLATSFVLLAHAQGRRVALLIGNADYAHERRLRNPVNDAELLARVLREDLKFDVVRVERNLDLRGMSRVLERFGEDAKQASTAVFYFSGHGVTSPGERRSFLLPVDARTGAPDSLPLRFQSIGADDVRDALRKAGARVTLMLLDACRDGPGDAKSGSKGLARVGGGDQFLVAYATEEGLTAADGGGANSPYAEALAQAWRQTRLPILSQLDYVHDIVSARVPGQRPTREGNLRADAYLGKPMSTEAAVNRDRIEDEAWMLCRAGLTRLPCDEYLIKWPDGRYVGLVRTRLRELEAVATPALAILREPQRPGPGAEVQTCTPTYYTIKSGDSMASIGLDLGVSWRDLVRENRIENPNAIEVGQVLRVPCAAGTPVVAATSGDAQVQQGESIGPQSIPWTWPADGEVIRRFDAGVGDGGAYKGIGISGPLGSRVVAAADGRVVYAGSGLKGQGNLIVIKHSNVFLTAYAHNRRLLVKEDRFVRRGELIAEMGNSDSDVVILRFEIRENGKPVDPLSLLPRR